MSNGFDITFKVDKECPAALWEQGTHPTADGTVRHIALKHESAETAFAFWDTIAMYSNGYVQSLAIAAMEQCKAHIDKQRKTK